MCEGRCKGASTEEFDIISRPVIGQLLLFLFRHDGLEILKSESWRALAVDFGTQARDVAPRLPGSHEVEKWTSVGL